MELGILFFVIFIFAIRGFFLGFTAVISRLLGFIIAYAICYSYGESLATYIEKNTSIEVSFIILQLVSSVLLFFTSAFLTGLIVSQLAKFLSLIIPSLKSLLDNQSIGSRLLGTVCNTAVGIILVLAASWAYQLVSPQPIANTQLSQLATRFGDVIEPLLSNMKLSNKKPGTVTSSSNTAVNTSHKSRSSAGDASRTKGTAFIVSEQDPTKTMSIGYSKQQRALISPLPEPGNSPTPQSETKPANTISPQNLIDDISNETFQNVLQNPELKRFVKYASEKNPELFEKIRNSPLLKRLLEGENSSYQGN